MRSFRHLLAAGIFAALATQTASADVYEASFEGGWFDATQSGRGVLVDYIPQAAGNGAYFITLYTYDTQGNPLWLTLQAEGREGTRVFTGVQVRRFNGGTPGNTFTPPNPAAGTLVGTATVDFASCNSLKIDFAPGAGITLPAVNLNYTRLNGAAASSCPFTTAFTTCPTGTTAVAGQTRVCEIPAGTVTGDLRLNNSASYVLGGRVQIGSALAADGSVSGPTGALHIQPGTIVRGKAGALSRIVVSGGSKIYAEGSPVAPVVLTGPTETGEAEQGSWGGLIIAGRAPVNSNCTGPNSITCAFEFDSAALFGGSNPADNSGVLRYVQIRSAGAIVVPPDRDLNALTLGGVGNGTTIEYVQAHNGSDDGFEMFGGTVNLKYIVSTGVDDDNIDTDFGYNGKIQYAYIKQDAGAVADSHGIESDNGPAGANFDASPRTRPTLVNATFDGSGKGFDGIRIRRGSGFILHNVVVSGFINACVNFNDGATYLAGAPAGQPTALTGNLVMTGSFLGCTKNFDDQAADPWLISAWYNGQASNAIGDISAAFTTGGRFPTATSALRTGAVTPTDAFFNTGNVKGAFADGDWTAGWTIGLN